MRLQFPLVYSAQVPRYSHFCWATFLPLAVGIIAACASAPASAPTFDELGNLTYLGIYGQPVTLTNGVYEGPPFVAGGASRPRVQLIGPLHAVGDLDGVANPEIAVLLAESAGGSGVRTFVAIVTRREGRPANVATRLIGDRVQIRRLAIENGAVVLEIIAAGPNEAMCCPTAKRRLVLQLTRRAWHASVWDELVQALSQDLGPLTLTDLEGVTWRLVQVGRNGPLPETVSVTATFKGEQLSGSGGCNRYFGSVSGGPHELKLGPIGATRRACEPSIMAFEDRYLAALGRTTKFGFHLGQLALTYQSTDGIDTLLFEAAP
jgi:heat shock protein HslJ